MNDSIRTIFSRAGSFFSGTMLSRLTGVGRDIAMASAFGASAPVAALMVAYRLSHFLRRLLGEGALQTAFIPLFEQERRQGQRDAYLFFSGVAKLLTLSLLAVIAITAAAIALPLAYDLFSPDNSEIAYLTLLLMPSLFFICLYGLNTALLQCEGSYFVASAAPAAFNLVWIAAVAALKNFEAEAAMPWLAAAITAACMMQWLITVPKTHALKQTCKSDKGTLKYGYAIIAPLMLAITGVAAAQINSACDALFSRYASLEGPAYLWYAIRLQQLPLALFGIALSGALLPPLARATKNGDEKSYSNYLSTALSACTTLLLPLSIAFIVAGDSCVNLLFGHGDFSVGDTIETTKCLWGYSIGLLPMGIAQLLAAAFYAKGDYATPARATAASVALNLTLNSLFIAALNLGPSSVAAATGISAWANAAILWHMLKKKSRFHIQGTVRTLLATAAGILCIFAFSNAASIFQNEPLLLPNNIKGKALLFAQQALLFGTPVAIHWLVCLIKSSAVKHRVVKSD